MARKLRVITQKIDGHLALRFGVLEDLPKGRPVAPSQDHPVFRAALLQGEAFLVRAFFATCLSKGFRDPDSQMKIWDRLIARRHMFVELCERSNLNKYSRYLMPQDEGQDYKERCYLLFCLFLHDLDVSSPDAHIFWHDVQVMYQAMVLNDAP